jgi:hypothetical protein
MFNVIKKNRSGCKLFIFFLVFLMLNQSIIVLAGADRIYPTKTVTLYRGDQRIGEYTKEAPLPEGIVISTNGRCAVKLDDLYLVAEDQSVFSINTSARKRNLFVKKGVIFFKTSSLNRSLAFITPNGPVDVQRIRLHASADGGTITGFLSVSEQQTQLGVAQGGALDVLTDKGPTTIESGKKIILSQADMDIGLPDGEEPAAQELPETKPESTAAQEPPETKPKTTTGKKIAYGALGVAAIVALAGAGGGGGGGGGGSVSPSTP